MTPRGSKVEIFSVFMVQAVKKPARMSSYVDIMNNNQISFIAINVFRPLMNTFVDT